MPELEHQNRIFKKEIFTDRDISSQRFIDCHFVDCTFINTRMLNTRFVDCVFEHCNLSNPVIDGASFLHAQFVESKIVGVDFWKCESKTLSVVFLRSQLTLCSFSHATLPKASFEGSHLTEVTFTESILKSANFSEVIFEACAFHHCDLTEADFTRARGYMINPLYNTLKKATFSLPDAVGLLSGFDIQIT